MVNENDFYNILNRIARALENINSSLARIEASGRKEADQYVRESKHRMYEKRRLLNENKSRNKFIRDIESQIKNPEEAVSKILKS